MKITHFAIVAMVAFAAVSRGGDEQLPSGIDSAGTYEIGITSMTDEAVAYINQPEFAKRKAMRLEFRKGITDADLARLKELPWATRLYFRGVEVPVDVEHLRPCKGLEVVSFNAADIQNLAVLKEFRKLREVNVQAAANVTDLEWVRDLTQITELSLSHMEQITDYTPLTGLKNIEVLNLGDHRQATVKSLAPLRTLVNLRELEFGFYGGSDLSPFAACTKLEKVDMIFAGSLVDISAAANWKNLQKLNLWGTKVTDLKPLARAKSLTWLNLTGTPVTDLTPIGRLPELRTLWLRESAVVDVRPLSRLPKLDDLDISDTAVTDISPLKSIKTLTSLKVPKGTDPAAIKALQKSLPEATIRD